MKTIRVDDDTHSKLMRVKGSLQSRTDIFVTMDFVLESLANRFLLVTKK